MREKQFFLAFKPTLICSIANVSFFNLDSSSLLENTVMIRTEGVLQAKISRVNIVLTAS
jgi:hypothetical protein